MTVNIVSQQDPQTVELFRIKATLLKSIEKDFNCSISGDSFSHSPFWTESSVTASANDRLVHVVFDKNNMHIDMLSRLVGLSLRDLFSKMSMLTNQQTGLFVLKSKQTLLQAEIDLIVDNINTHFINGMKDALGIDKLPPNDLSLSFRRSNERYSFILSFPSLSDNALNAIRIMFAHSQFEPVVEGIQTVSLLPENKKS